MAIVLFNGESFHCTTALKGADYIHLLDSNGAMTTAFDGITDFSGFTIEEGSWTTPTSPDNCRVAVIMDDGSIGKGSYTSGEIGAAVTSAKLADGAVTSGKLASNAVSKSLTVTLAVASWSSKKQSVTASGVTASNTVIVSPAPASFLAYGEAQVRCTAQAANSLTFQCETVPTAALTVNVTYINK